MFAWPLVGRRVSPLQAAEYEKGVSGTEDQGLKGVLLTQKSIGNNNRIPRKQLSQCAALGSAGNSGSGRLEASFRAADIPGSRCTN